MSINFIAFCRSGTWRALWR